MKLNFGKLNPPILIQIFITVMLALIPAAAGKLVTMVNEHGIAWACNKHCTAGGRKQHAACQSCCPSVYSDSTHGRCIIRRDNGNIVKQNGKIVYVCSCTSYKKLETKTIPTCKDKCYPQVAHNWNCVECCRTYNRMWNGGTCVPGYTRKSKQQCYCESEVQPKPKKTRGSRSVFAGTKSIGNRRRN